MFKAGWKPCLAGIIGLILGSSAVPQRAAGQELTRLLLEFGTARAALYGVLIDRPKGGSRLAYRLADVIALNPNRKSYPYVSQLTWGVTPALRYEGNVNNGIDAEKIMIGGFPFIIDKKDRAISAMTAGAALQASGAFALSRGLLLNASARSELRRSIEGEKFTVAEHSSNFNLSYTTNRMAYFSLALGASRRETDFNESKSKYANLSIGKIFGKSAVHDVSFGVGRFKSDDDWQTRLSSSWSLAKAGLGHVSGRLMLGERVDGRMMVTKSAALSYSNFIWNRPTTFELSAAYAEGGKFIGRDRTDKIYGFRIERQLLDSINGYTSISKRSSSAELYDATTIDVGFLVRGLKF